MPSVKELGLVLASSTATLSHLPPVSLAERLDRPSWSGLLPLPVLAEAPPMSQETLDYLVDAPS